MTTDNPAPDYSEEKIFSSLKLLSEKIHSARSQAPLPDGEIDGQFSNRGQKLKLGATKVHRDRLDGFNNDIDDVEEVEYANVKREVVKRRRIDTYNILKTQDDDDDEVLENRIYEELDLLKILAPIQQPSDIVTRDSLKRTYQSDVLKKLAQQAIEIVEKEQDTVIQLGALLDIFLCEDTSQLLESKLQLPVYEPDKQDREVTTTPQLEEVDLDKRITRRQSTQDASDPFFALPSLTMDPDYGLNAEDAEEARQLTQIALQRNEEFIRNLSNLRMGLSRAQTIKEKLFKWAKEMNGDPDLSDEYQKEKVEAAATAAAAGGSNPSTATATANDNEKANRDSFNISGVSGSNDDEAVESSSTNVTPVPEPTRRSGRRGGKN